MNYPTVQDQLDLKVEKEVEINGVGMGVLSDGTPYLTGRGLARLCGVDNAPIVRLGSEWSESVQKPRVTKIKQILDNRGVSLHSPYLEVNGSRFWTGSVCLAVLEYYAFDALQNDNAIALQNYRTLAGRGFEEFVYAQVGYDPNQAVPEQWKQFHDRVSLTYDSVPAGYFSIFKEIADMVVTLGQAGLHIDHKFVPDISVGRTWSSHWTKNNLEQKFGERDKYEHNYPDYFPQAMSNPQVPWCYPESALGEFRRWFREVYIGDGKLSTYLSNQAKAKALPASFSQIALKALKK
ncbi:hypothetical protein [Endozoicomonas elysicola]|uniref:BstA-like C-terminal domain-containing protein n=1 Tax=Endozoicomonas elysicola TaxID=305900 RepID=A0A081K9F3_9GAMM|nr:hypothetical protein [Endozoicomonas elysicola]KEI70779.1 hypothetical protein GV64_08500 [Endozoicomonas elysicola]